MSKFIVAPPVLPQQKEIEQKKDVSRQSTSQSVRAKSSQLLWAKILGKTNEATEATDYEEEEEEEVKQNVDPRGLLKFDTRDEYNRNKLQSDTKTTSNSGRFMDKAPVPSRNFKGFGLTNDSSSRIEKVQTTGSVSPPACDFDDRATAKKAVLSKAASKYAQFKCTMCDYSGYTLQLLEAHRKLRNHYPLGMGDVGQEKRGPLLRPCMPAMDEQRQVPKVRPLLPSPHTPMQYRPVLESHFQPEPTPSLPHSYINETLAKFGIAPNSIPYDGLTSSQFLERLEQLLHQKETADLEQKKQAAQKQQQQQQQKPAMSDTERLLTVALEAKDYKTAKQLTDLLEKERQIETEKASLAKLMGSVATEHKTVLESDQSQQESVGGTVDDFQLYWAKKRAATTESAQPQQQQTEESQPAAKRPLSKPKPLTHFSYEKQMIPDGTEFAEVTLTYMADDPSFFWVHLAYSEHKLVQINDEIYRLWNSNSLVPVELPVKPGLGCVAYLDIKGNWYHRVEVVQQMENGEIRFRLIDEGRLASVENANLLRYLPDDSNYLSQTTALAVPCSVANFRPNQRWATNGQDCFQLFKTAISGAKRVCFLGRSEHGIYRLGAYSDRGQALASFLANKNVGVDTSMGASSWQTPIAAAPRQSFFF